MAKKTSKASASRTTTSSKKTTKKKVTKKKTSKKTTQAAKATRPQTSSPAPSANGNEKKKTSSTRKPKNPLTKRELDKYRNMLLIKRAEIRGDMDSMTAEALLNHDAANLSHMPIHMADVGSDQYEQELTLNLVESERRLLTEIEEALGRIEDGTYGICAESGEAINKARLDAKPWAKYTIEVARQMERNQPHHRR